MFINRGKCPQVFYHNNESVEIPPNTCFDEGAYPEGAGVKGMEPVRFPSVLSTLPAGTRIVIRRVRSMPDALATYAALTVAAKMYPKLRFQCTLAPQATEFIPHNKSVEILARGGVGEGCLGLYLNYVSGYEKGSYSGGQLIGKLFGFEFSESTMLPLKEYLVAKADGALGKTDTDAQAIASTVEAVEGILAPSIASLKPGARVLIYRRWGGLGDQVMLGMTVSDLCRQRPDLKVTVSVPREYLPLWEQFPIETIPAERLTGGYLWRFDFVRDCSRACSEAPAVHAGERVTTHRAERWAKHIGFELRSFETFLKPTEEELVVAMQRFGNKDKPRVAFAPMSHTTFKAYPYLKQLLELCDNAGYESLIFHNKALHPPVNAKQPAFSNPREIMAALATCDVLVTVMTSMYNFGNILKKPTVAIIGPEDEGAYQRAFPECSFLKVDFPDRACPCWGHKADNCIVMGVLDCCRVPQDRVFLAIVNKLTKGRRTNGSFMRLWE